MGPSNSRVSHGATLPLRRWLAAAGGALASVFFPAGCRLCDSLLTKASRLPVCEDCLSSFIRVPEHGCVVCGLPFPAMPTAAPHDSGAQHSPAGTTTDSLLCGDCRRKAFAFERARSFALYDRAAVRAVLLLKFDRVEPLARWFALQLAALVESQPGLLTADVVVPVPLHRERERERGYNQAALIAKPLAKRLKLPYKPVLLVRTKPRPDKRILTVNERWESVRGAFATAAGSQVDKQRVLLVDDVMTTGATLDACARALREAGAISVVSLTVARSVRNLDSGSSPERL